MKNPWDFIKVAEKDVNILRVDNSHPLDLFWARDHFGNYLFFYEYQGGHGSNKLPKLEGLRVELRQSEDKTYRLLLSLNENSNWEIFSSLCSDIINSTYSLKEQKHGFSAILNRLLKWRDFLSTKRAEILSEEQIKGLIGELLFLKNQLIPKYGRHDAINFWTGPGGTAQDFNVNDSSVEVKAQMAGTSPNIKISSADQLCSQSPNLYLCVLTLGKTTSDNASRINLPKLISAISEMLSSESQETIIRFQDLLLEVGYIDSELYDDYNYILNSIRVFVVEGNFPRICPDNLISGITKVTYSIHLAACEKHEISFSKWGLIND